MNVVEQSLERPGGVTVAESGADGKGSVAYLASPLQLRTAVKERCFIWGDQTKIQACSTPVKEI